MKKYGSKYFSKHTLKQKYVDFSRSKINFPSNEGASTDILNSNSSLSIKQFWSPVAERNYNSLLKSESQRQGGFPKRAMRLKSLEKMPRVIPSPNFDDLGSMSNIMRPFKKRNFKLSPTTSKTNSIEDFDQVIGQRIQPQINPPMVSAKATSANFR